MRKLEFATGQPSSLRPRLCVALSGGGIRSAAFATECALKGLQKQGMLGIE